MMSGSLPSADVMSVCTYGVTSPIGGGGSSPSLYVTSNPAPA